MDLLYSQLQSVNSPDEGKTSGFAASQTKDTLNKVSLDLEPPTTAVSGDTRYLTRLWVSRHRDEVSQSEPSQSTITGVGFEHRDHNVYPHCLKIPDKIKLVLKLLHFRESRVLVQFWSPHIVGNHKVLTTIDQPFGLGVIDEGLSSYRRDSERNICVLDNNQDDHPTTRVFRQGLPEWSTDLTNYLPKYFPQQEYALQCNLHGYLALPVFNSSTRVCLGVLELLTSSKYRSYAFEVRQLYIALKAADLTTTQAFDRPTSKVHNEHMNSELEKILSILRVVCEIHRLPLAQTWAILSPFSSYASHEQILKMSCNSFDSRCLGKTCLSTAALPFHVQDLGLWPFRKACKELHLDKSCSFIGKALFSRGSCFCEDVTKLSEEEYPLVHYAHINGITSCFAIYLHGVESNADYVLEFFLPLNIEEGRHVQNLVQTLKQHIEMASVFELGDKSLIQVVGPSREASSLFLNTDPQSTIISSTITTKTKIPDTVSSDSESFVADLAKTDSTHVLNQLSPKQDFLNNNGGTITSSAIVIHDDVIRDDIVVVGAGNDENATSNHDVSMQIASNTVTGAREKSNLMKRGRKRKIDSLTMEAVNKHVGKPIDEAAKSLGVSRSTLKRFCRDHDMTSWPLPKHNKKTARVTDSKLSQKSRSIQPLQGSSSVRFGFFDVVILLVRVKRWSCLSKNHGFSGKWWSCGKHSYLPFKLDSMYQVARLMLSLKRWKNKNSIRHAMQNRDHLTDSTEKPKNERNIINPGSSPVYASPKQIVARVVSDIKKVTVKATFKDDIIKFQLPTSSGLFELENEVAQRIKLQNKRVRLKYRDEDDDMILLACDADLHNLLGISTSNNCIIKLSIQLVDE